MATTNLGKVSVTPKGEYDPLVTYERLDIISHNGSSYIVKQASTGVTPIEGEFYALIAEKGDGGSFVKKAYKTYAAMDADKVNIPANSSVDVTNDPDESKNGAYIYDGVAFTRSQYDSKVVTDKIIADASQSVQNAISGVAVDANLVTDALTTIVPMSSGAIARTQLEKNRENISVLDFFTDVELTAYKANKSTFDAYRPLQAFFDYITLNDVGTAKCDGEYRISKGLYFGVESKTKTIVGSLILRALAPIDIMLHIQFGMACTWLGSIAVYGTGGVSWASRTCKIGVKLGGNRRASKSLFASISAFNFSEIGVFIDNNTAQNNMGELITHDCGSGLQTTAESSYSLFTNYSDATFEDAAGTINQTTTITVDTLPPITLETPVFVCISNDYYIVQSVDRVASTLKLLAWIDLNETTGNLRYVFGGGVVIKGSDAGVIKTSKIDAIRCGIGLHSTSLYGALSDNLVTQFCGVAVAFGAGYVAAHLGGQINGLYCEANNLDILRVTRAQLGISIVSSHVLDFGKIKSVTSVRSADNVRSYPDISGISIQKYGGFLSRQSAGTSLSVTSYERQPAVVMLDRVAIGLTAPDETLYNLFNLKSRQVLVVGTGDNGRPTSAVMFQPPAGWTIAGNSSTLSFSDFSSAALFTITADLETKNFNISSHNSSPKKHRQNLSNTVVAANSSVEIPITSDIIKGIEGILIMTYTGLLRGVSARIQATGVGTATLFLYNHTSADITVGGGVLFVRVI